MKKQWIPKKIHYFWFGGNPLPESVKKCIESWEMYCPDYEIIRWDETNYDYTKHPYMKEAYESKKWSFVSDYARMDILYQYGGIYLDTDVEVIRSFDPLLEYECFMGFDQTYINLGHGFGARPGLPELKGLMDVYDGVAFIKADGSLNLTPITEYTNKYLETIGLHVNGKRQKVGNIEIFPQDYFCPKDYYTRECHITEHTYSIHHYDSSWWGEKEKQAYEKEVELKTKNIWVWRFHNGVRVLKEEGTKGLWKKVIKMFKKNL